MNEQPMQMLNTPPTLAEGEEGRNTHENYKRHLQGIFSTALTQQLIPIVETILLIQSNTLAFIAYT